MNNVLKAKDTMSVGLRGYKEFVQYNWHGKIITIKTLLSFKEEVELIQFIVDLCKSDDNCIMIEYVDMAIRIGITKAYAAVEIPDDLEDAHKVLYASDLYDVILKNANSVQVNTIINTIKRIVW